MSTLPQPVRGILGQTAGGVNSPGSESSAGQFFQGIAHLPPILYTIMGLVLGKICWALCENATGTILMGLALAFALLSSIARAQ